MSDASLSIRCMVLPLSSINLVVPNSAVAEIISYSAPKKLADCSDWFRGVVLWRGVSVPVIAVEEMCSIDSAQVGPRARLAILYNPNKDEQLPYFGVQMQGIPRAYLAKSDSMQSCSGPSPGQYLISYIGEQHAASAIPNFDAIITDLKLEFSAEKVEQATR